MELNRDRHLPKHCVCRLVSRQLKLRRMTRRQHPMIRRFFPCAPHKLGEFNSREKYAFYLFIYLLVRGFWLTQCSRWVMNGITRTVADCEAVAVPTRWATYIVDSCSVTCVTGINQFCSFCCCVILCNISILRSFVAFWVLLLHLRSFASRQFFRPPSMRGDVWLLSRSSRN